MIFHVYLNSVSMSVRNALDEKLVDPLIRACARGGIHLDRWMSGDHSPLEPFAPTRKELLSVCADLSETALEHADVSGLIKEMADANAALRRENAKLIQQRDDLAEEVETLKLLEQNT